MDRRVEAVLNAARAGEASDIILKEGEIAVYRINGRLEACGVPIDSSFMDELFRNLTNASAFYPGLPPSVDLAFECRGRYRANLFTAEGRKCAVLRVIRDRVGTLEELGLPEMLVERIARRKGLSLVVGKTGSGKSTTLAAITQEILKREDAHVVTLEDPVEFRLQSKRGTATQRELGRDFSSFEDGIYQALRQSPDFIVIGEIRNLSSLKAALTAAEAGHGIIGTIHSSGASRTLTRMLAMIPEAEKEFARFQISSVLNFMLSQRLEYSESGPSLDYELLLNVPSVENTIREGRINQLDNLIFLGEKLGMRRFSTST